MATEDSFSKADPSTDLGMPLLDNPSILAGKVEMQDIATDSDHQHNAAKKDGQRHTSFIPNEIAGHENRNLRTSSRTKSMGHDLELLPESHITMVEYLNEGTKATPVFPSVLEWGRPSELKKNFIPDLMAGLTVAAVLCSEALAVAMMGGLPPHYGLYPAAVPVMVYALFGSSKNVQTGPVSVVAILLGSIVMDIEGEHERAQVACFLSLTVGVLMILLGVLKMGFIEYLLSLPALKGFVAGIVVRIIIEQIQNVLQIKFQAHTAIPRFIELFQRINEWNIPSLIIGICVGIFLAGLVALKEYKKSKALIFFLGPLLTSVIGTIVVWMFSLDTKYGIRLVQDIEQDIPTGIGFSLPFHKFFEYFEEHIAEVFVVTLIGYIETIAISKEVATQKGYKIDATIEFVSFGIANLVAAFCLSFPVFGSLSRTPINVTAGNISQLSGFFTGLTVFVVCYIGIPIIKLIPLTVVGATIIFAVIKKVVIGKLIFLCKYYFFPDGVIMGLAMFTTIFLNPEVGAGVTVFFSMLVILKKGTTPWLDIEHYNKTIIENPSINPSDDASAIMNNSSVKLNASGLTNPNKKYKAQAKMKNRDKSIMVMSFKDWDKGKYKEFCLCLNLHCHEKYHMLIITLPKDFYYLNSHSLRINLEPLKALSPMFKRKGGVEIKEDVPSKTINAILIDCHKTKHIDFTACQTIIEMSEELGKTGIQMALSELDLSLLRPMKETGLDPKLARYSNRDTVEMVEKLMDKVLIEEAKRKREAGHNLGGPGEDEEEEEGLSRMVKESGDDSVDMVKKPMQKNTILEGDL